MLVTLFHFIVLLEFIRYLIFHSAQNHSVFILSSIYIKKLKAGVVACDWKRGLFGFC